MVTDEKITRLVACRLKGHQISEIGLPGNTNTICLTCHWANMSDEFKKDRLRGMSRDPYRMRYSQGMEEVHEQVSKRL